MIYASHGVVTDYSSDNFCHYNFLDQHKLENFLKNKMQKYVSLSQALVGQGDAFTIDDSTYAALKMANILRSYDHQVTIFVNPYYVEYQIDYWFVILNYLLQHYSYASINWNGIRYDMNSYQKKLIFRKMLKEIISIIDSEEQRHNFLGKVFNLTIADLKLPTYLKTITKQDIVSLQNIGVDIQNHGWTHKQLKGASLSMVLNEILLGRNWFKQLFGIDTRFYAVPFGDTLPPSKEFDTSVFDYWFSLQKLWQPGVISHKIYNRLAFRFNTEEL